VVATVRASGMRHVWEVRLRIFCQNVRCSPELPCCPPRQVALSPKLQWHLMCRRSAFPLGDGAVKHHGDHTRLACYSVQHVVPVSGQGQILRGGIGVVLCWTEERPGPKSPDLAPCVRSGLECPESTDYGTARKCSTKTSTHRWLLGALIRRSGRSCPLFGA
jgi:hypothetical protein